MTDDAAPSIQLNRILGQSRLTEELVEQGGCKVPARLFSVRGTGGFSQSRDQGVGSEI
jgi:hypothetical protein